MKAEVIYIGTELLLGEVLNTNAVFLGSELMSLGIDCYFQTVVGDNKDRIKESFQTALQRADLVITTGGLGPTPDDLTTECWAEFFDKELILDEVVLEEIKDKFKKLNRTMSPSNAKQAYRPQTADLFPNPAGSAPGIIWDVKELCEQKNISTSDFKIVMTFPGVPRELKAMWKTTARDFLSSKIDASQKLFWKELRFYGIGESSLAEKVQDLLDLPDPTVAPLAGKAECLLRLATKAPTESEANIKLQSVEAEIKNRVGEFLYGYNSDTLESVVGKLLSEKQETLAVVESCTGGLLSKRLTDIAGSSNYIKLNATTYSNESKHKLLAVSQNTLQSCGAVSEQVALQMAQGMKALAESDWALSITGIAGPGGGSEEKPVGTVYMALIGKNFQETKLFHFGSRSRSDIRWITTQEALNWLRITLLK